MTNGDTVRYAYDALGRKARRIGPANDTTYTLWAGNDIAATLNNAGQATALYTHAPGIDQPVSVRAGGAGAATYTYALDAMGNVVGLLDGSGQVAKVYRYGPFGEAELDSLGLVNALRFKARELDPHTGLYDMRARWYDPATGRFVSEDPIALAGGINEYAFAGNDPVNLSDPFGLEPCMARIEYTYRISTGEVLSWRILG